MAGPSASDNRANTEVTGGIGSGTVGDGGPPLLPLGGEPQPAPTDGSPLPCADGPMPIPGAPGTGLEAVGSKSMRRGVFISGQPLSAPPDSLGQQMLFEGAPPLSIGMPIFPVELDTVRRFTLANGLVVNLTATPTASMLEAVVFFRSGKLNDPPGKTGLAHFVEHLACPGAMLADSESRIERALENDALNLRAATNTHTTCFSMRGDSHQAEAIMTRLGEIFRRPEIPEAILEREKKVIASERLESEAPPFIDFARREFERFYGGTWGRQSSVLGTSSDVKSFTTADVAEYWDTHLVPGNAEITLATSDFSRILPLLDTHLGSLPASDHRPFQEYLGDGPVSEPRPRTLWHQAPYEGAAVVVRFPSISETSREGAAVHLAARMLARGASGLIYDKVRSEDGLMYGPGHVLLRTPGGASSSFMFFLEDPRTIEQALGGIAQAMKAMQSPEFVRARMNHENWSPRERPPYFFDGVAQNLVCFGKAMGTIEFQQALFTVTPEEVCAAARKIFDPRKATLAVYTSAPARALPLPWGAPL